MPLQKAIIEIDEKDLGGKFPPRIECQFNPTEYTRTKGAQIAEIAIPGIDSPILQFVRGQTEKFAMDLFFDTTESGMGESGAVSVTTLTDPLYQLVKMQSNTHAPPRIHFVWGTGLSFKAIVETIQQKFTLFNPAGVPLRATLSVSFAEYKTLEDQIGQVNPMSADHTRRCVVAAGDRLPHIAFREYGDAAQWRAIADANRDVLTDLRTLVPGTELKLPPIENLAKRGARG